MISELERQIRDELAADAQQARLVNPDRPPAPAVDVRRGIGPPPATHRLRSLAVVSAAAVLAVAVVFVIRVERDNRQVDRDAPDGHVTAATTARTMTPPDGTSATSTIPSTVPPATGAVASRWVDDVGADSLLVLPDAPIAGRVGPAGVWTGTEMLVWGGAELLEPSGEAALGDGAAFNPSTGEWRTLAAAPIVGRSYPAAVWTGAELFVWGGSQNGVTLADGAAYDPVADTWRMLPEAPIGDASKGLALWTGEEVIVLTGMRSVDGAGVLIGEAAAYDPAANSWRRLADPPGTAMPPYPQAVWTGETVLATLWPHPDERVATPTSSEDTITHVRAAYDVRADSWTILDDDTDNPFLIATPAADQPTASVLAFGGGDVPVHLLDGNGALIAEITGRPAELDGYGNIPQAVWSGREVLFWSGGDPGLAFDPTTQQWRSYPGGDVDPRTDGIILWAGEVMLSWAGFPAAADGIAYRPPEVAPN